MLKDVREKLARVMLKLRRLRVFGIEKQMALNKLIYFEVEVTI